MSFLTRTTGMTSNEAREICQLHELVQESLSSGPVALMTKYAQIWRVKAESVDSVERNARRLVARLKGLGYLVLTEGDGEKLTLDFSDRHLAVDVAASIDHATSVYDSGQSDEPGEDGQEPASLEAIAADHRLGLTIRQLMRRYGLRQDRVRLLLAAKGCLPHREGRLRVEEKRSAGIVSKALEAHGEGANLRQVARILGCSPETARAFLRRMKRLST